MRVALFPTVTVLPPPVDVGAGVPERSEAGPAAEEQGS